MFNPNYAHYQPQPHPLHHQQLQQQPLHPQQQPEQPYSQPFSAKPNPPFNQPNGYQAAYGGNYGGQGALGANGMGVGSGAGDFELFGPSPSPPQPAPPSQQQAAFYQHQPYAFPSQQQRPYGYSIPSSSSRSSISSASDSARSTNGDAFPPLPDLVPDAGGDSPLSHSPPSPRFSLDSQPRAPFLSAAQATKATNGGGGSALGPSASNPFLNLGGFSFGGMSGAGIERPASVPIPDPPRPVRRKTQERRDWPSFYSSGSSSSSSSSTGQYMPFAPQTTEEPASYAPPGSSASSASSQNHPPPFDPATLALSPAAAYAHYQPQQHQQQRGRAADPLPHPDHPLLPSEQSDLLDRVRRDLLELDVDLSSIKGPLRALALSNTERDRTPTPSAITVPPTQTTPKAASLRSPATSVLADDALSVGTVSPQEAFLDYTAVDSRLHDPADPLYSGGKNGEFGVGVGGSLFAPLPGQQQQQGRAASPKVSSPLAQSRQHQQHPPQPYHPSPSPSSTYAGVEASPAPSAASGTASRRPHPFSVPQNAVTWAERRSRSGQHWLGGALDGDADDDDGDFTVGESESTEDSETEQRRREEAVRKQARLGEGFGRFRKEEADLKTGDVRLSQEERARYGLDEVGRPIPGSTAAAAAVEEDGEGEVTPKVEDKGFSFGAYGGKKPVYGSTAPSQPAQLKQQHQVDYGLFQFAPPAQQHQPHQPFPFSFSASNAAQHLLPSLPISATGSGTNTPQRAAAASALAGLNAFAPPPPAQQQQSYPPPPALAPAADSQTTPQRPQRNRKRSRIAQAALYGDDYAVSSAAGVDAAVDEEDDVHVGGGDFVPPPPGSTGSSAAAEDASFQGSSQGDYDPGHESDASYRSSASSFGYAPAASAPSGGTRRAHPSSASSGPPPPKRRRRAPAASSAAAAGPNAILCDHTNADGSPCGVAFRRPYDLARHKETIHGEDLGGGKVKSKEWKCEECGGTFSRRDALLRHGRIRGHKIEG
ncbi:hypothetical protein JCM8097_005092 [Rhodosporidiobolus ruineniae]